MDSLSANKSFGPASAATPASITSWQSLPVTWWSVVGVLFLVVQLLIWGKWLMSDGFTPTLPPPVGDDYGLGRLYFVRAFEAAGIIGTIAALWHWVWRPFRKEGRLTTDGMAMLIMPLLWFQDPYLNYTAPWFSYSSIFLNFGNWVGHTPGALSPNVGVMPEPIIVASCGYIFMVAVPILVVLSAMRAWKRRYPESSSFVIFAVGMGGGFVYDFIVEGAACFGGLWSYWGSIQSLCIFGGHYYQFPLYEPVLWGGYSGILANILYWKNDKGQTYSERGLERLKISSTKKEFVRFFAMFGLFSVLMLAVYNVPAQWFATHGDRMPADTPQHLRNGICGEGTPFACPGPGVPFNRGTEGYIVTPEMTLEKGTP